jgi:hypothetical protein
MKELFSNFFSNVYSVTQIFLFASRQRELRHLIFLHFNAMDFRNFTLYLIKDLAHKLPLMCKNVQIQQSECHLQEV